MHIQTPRTTLHVSDRGTGDPALIFLHYRGGSARTWDAVTEELSTRYRSLAIDQRGWGDSQAPTYGYGIADLANDAQDVIAALGLTHYVLIGHSMGGKVAQALAARRPRGLEA